LQRIAVEVTISKNLRPVSSSEVPREVGGCMSHVDNSESSAISLRLGLMTSARSGSLSSLGQLLETFRTYLLLIADDELESGLRHRVSPSDIVQESCLEAQRDFSLFQGTTEDEFRGWLRKLTLNNIRNAERAHLEAEKRDVRRETKDSSLRHVADHSGTTGIERLISSERLFHLHAALQCLSPDYRDVIRLRNYERLSFEDIAARMERSSEAARKLWCRAIEMLQKELGSLNDSSRTIQSPAP
jgi:RNA polymerase sigma-70 factor, ECF subfamily